MSQRLPLRISARLSHYEYGTSILLHAINALIGKTLDRCSIYMWEMYYIFIWIELVDKLMVMPIYVERFIIIFICENSICA